MPLALLATAVNLMMAASLLDAQDNRTMEQIRLLQLFEGDWKFDRVYREGHEFHPVMMESGARFSEVGMHFFDASGRVRERVWKFTRIDVADERIDIAGLGGEIKRQYVAKLDGDTVWLVSNFDDPSKLPDELRPGAGNFCIVLVRDSGDDDR